MSQHATGLPLGMVPDDLAWMAQLVGFTSQALLYAQQWALVLSMGDRAHNLFPLHLLAPLDKRDPDAVPPSLLWSSAEVRTTTRCRGTAGWSVSQFEHVRGI